MGVPGFAKPHIYNYVALSFWTTGGAVDIAKIWEKPTNFMGSDSSFGKTDTDIRNSLKKAYNDNGVKVLVSAFGSTDMPTGQDPVQIATRLADFVKTYNLDGCDVDYEDNDAMEAGTGEAWLIAFTKKLRELLPTHIITHAPQGPYFKNEYYKNGGYKTVDAQVGNLIDFYNVQFYNQGDTKYNSYNELFIHSTGFFSNTAVK
jgi:chitinase